MQDELGPKGMNVLSFSGESPEVVQKYLALGNPSPMTYTIAAGGNTGMKNPSGGIPYSWLVGSDGKVVWQGNGLPSGKVIDAELKKVKAGEELKSARAAKVLAHAETLVGEKQYVRAIRLLERIQKDYRGTDSAKKAAERKTAIEADEAAKVELSAQRDLEKILTGLDLPAEKFSGKERKSKLVQVEALLVKHKDATVAVEEAKQWAKVLTDAKDK